MECLTLVAVMLPLLIITNEISSAKLEDASMNSVKVHKRITKRQTPVDNHKSMTTEDFQKFVEDKLIQHSQALEFLVKLSNDAVTLISSLVENVGRRAEEPKLPEKVDKYHQEGEERTGDFKEVDHPIVKFAKNFPKYSGFYKDIIMKSFKSYSEPTPLVARNSRRSMGPLPFSDVSNINNGPERSGSTSQWCTVAVLCHKTQSSVCGYDESFGYGKFEDLCHMLQVNCYWKYNFALVPNCKSNF